jgi:hypothetical protein
MAKKPEQTPIAAGVKYAIIEPPTVVTVLPPQPSFPVSVPVQSLEANNSILLGKAYRRFREMVLEAQSKKADGQIVFATTLAGGRLTKKISISPRWDEWL